MPEHELQRRAARRVAFACAAAVTFLIAGCGGQPFKVKIRPDPPPSASGPLAESQGVSFQAEALTDEDYLYETFDANLIMAGILPVRVKVGNSSPEVLNLKRVRFEVGSGGRPLKMIDARRAYKRLVSYYGISTYSQEGYRESRDDFSAYALDLETPLPAGETRQGILFFQVPDEQIRRGGLTLLVRKLKVGRSNPETSVELKLN
jgi:hypothetical protein